MIGQIMLALLILLVTFGVLRGLSDNNGEKMLQFTTADI